jgi:hypothetical protein
MPETPSTPPNEPLYVLITREMFSVFFTLETPHDGYTEELELDDVRKWFKDRGANMDAVEEALTQAWNFLRSEVLIQNPKYPSTPRMPYAPDI